MNSTLIISAGLGDLAGIVRSLEDGEDINQQDARGRTAVMAATYAGQVAAVRLLLEREANPDIQDEMLNTPFLYAGAEGMLDILKLTNEAGADPAVTNRYGGTALIPACERGHADVVRYLLTNSDVDIDHVNRLGWTGLLEAIILSDGGPAHQEIVRILIEHGADVDLADGEGVTPLAHARARGYTEIARALREAGASE
jgi:ankyrin repeat protein